MIAFRTAQIEDINSITEIYNEAILNTTATFDTQIKTIEDRSDWFLQRDENFPVIVVEYHKKIVGYAALNKWSDKKAYDITAEISLYIEPGSRGQGIGKKLIEVIVTTAKEHTSLHSLIARITQGNEHSVYLHLMYGFEKIGVMKNVGQKFDKLLDVTLLQKMLR
jgi:phosphinothricin acetyltransferase